MPKKPLPDAVSPEHPASHLFDGMLAATVKESAQQIWLAGLGAFAKAQEEGSKAFEALVNEGTTLQRKTQTVAEEKLSTVSAQVSARMAEVTQKVEEVSAKATGQWGRLETIFEQRVAKALAQLGVPQASEVQALAEQVEQLRAQIAALKATAARPARKAPAARGATVRAPVPAPAAGALKRRTPKP